MIKTRQGWRESGQDLSRYLQVGDLVDEEMYDCLLNALPPAYWTSNLMQMGEPIDSGPKGATFATLKRTPDGWMYCGNCYHGQTEHVPSIHLRFV